MDTEIAFSALLVEAGLNSLWQGGVAVAAVLLLLKLFPRIPARGRYLVWWGALLLLLALALISSTYKAGRSAEAESIPSNRPTSLSSAAPRGPDMAASLERTPRASAFRPAPATPQTEAASSIGLHPEAVAPTEVASSGILQDDVSATVAPLRLTGGSWVSVLALLWLAGVFLRLFQLLRGGLHLRMLARESGPLPARLERRLVERWGPLGIGRSIRLRRSGRCTMPLALGLGFRRVLIPSSLLENLSDSELEQVVLHETAHLKRADDWTQLFQRLLEALFFFHPAVHWIGRRLDLERELACDEWVVSRTGKVKSYTDSLIRLVELSSRPRRPAIAPGGAVTRPMVSRRIEMILKKGERTSRWALCRGLVFVGASLLALFLLLTRLGPLVVTAEAAKAPFEVEAENSSPVEGVLSEDGGEGRLPAFSVSEARESLVETSSSSSGLGPAAAPEAEVGPGSSVQQVEPARVAPAEGESLEEEIRSRIERQLEETLSGEMSERMREVGERFRETSERMAEWSRRAAEERTAAFLPLPFAGVALPEEELVPLLEQIALEDPDPRVRSAALQGLARLRSDLALTTLTSLYDRTDEPDLRRQILVNQLVRSRPGEPELVTFFSRIARTESDPSLRRIAFNALAASQEGTELLISLYREQPEVEIRRHILAALAGSRSERAVELLKSVARSDPDPELRLEAVRRLSSAPTSFGPVGPWTFGLPDGSAPPVPPAPPERPNPPEPPPAPSP